MVVAAMFSWVATEMFINPILFGKLTKHEEALFEALCGHHRDIAPAALLNVKWAFYI